MRVKERTDVPASEVGRAASRAEGAASHRSCKEEIMLFHVEITVNLPPDGYR